MSVGGTGRRLLVPPERDPEATEGARMAAGWYAHRPALLLTAALAGAFAGWLARSRLAHRDTNARTVPERDVMPSTVPEATARGSMVPEPTVPEAAARGSTVPEPTGAQSGPTGPARGPSPLPEPVPFPEGTAVDAPYTAEEPYTGRPRYAPAVRPLRTDVPGGMPP